MDDVLILTTGGTIDKLYFDALSEFQVGSSVVNRLLEIARVSLPVSSCEIMRKDSLEISAQDRAAIVAAVREAAQDRVIITHGTDTMTRTAEALSEIAGKTIVLVGALAPARFAESDASFNLGLAFGAVQLAPRGVWIAMNGTVFPASAVRKDRAANTFVAT